VEKVLNSAVAVNQVINGQRILGSTSVPSKAEYLTALSFRQKANAAKPIDRPRNRLLCLPRFPVPTASTVRPNFQATVYNHDRTPTTTHPCRNFSQSHIAVAEQHGDHVQFLFRELAIGADIHSEYSLGTRPNAAVASRCSRRAGDSLRILALLALIASHPFAR